VIESGNNIELLDAQELVSRPEKIIIANEHNPLDWHGWLEIGRFKKDIETLSLKIYYVLIVKFLSNGTHYTGMAKIVSDPVAVDGKLKINPRGVDVLYIK
jgi:hypothetical protein